MKVLIANLPSLRGKMFVKEGRCSQSKQFWNTIWPPYSLVSIAAVLEEAGHNVKVHNYPAEKLGPGGFSALIKEFSPQAVIASCSTPTVTDDLETASIIKRLLPQAEIIFFGIHSTVFSKDIIEKYPFVDFIVRGEPEYTIKELISVLNDKPTRDFNIIKGITWRKVKNAVINEARGLISDLDELPIPAWHLINLNNYKLPFIGKPYLIVVPGRGCVDECLFCYAHKYYGRKNRRHSANRIIKELIYYKKRFRINRFFFWTENFTQDRKFLNALLDMMLSSKLNVHWSANSRVDTVDYDLLIKMKKAGCQIIAFGVESGNQHILDAAKKNITLPQIEEAFSLSQKAGLQTIANCMFGLPGETFDTMRQTAKFLKKLNPTYAQFYTAVPRPGSEFYKMASEEKWIRTKDWSRYHQGDYVLKMNGLDREQIVNFIKRSRLMFYLDLKRIFNISAGLIKAFFNI